MEIMKLGTSNFVYRLTHRSTSACMNITPERDVSYVT